MGEWAGISPRWGGKRSRIGSLWADWAGIGPLWEKWAGICALGRGKVDDGSYWGGVGGDWWPVEREVVEDWLALEEGRGLVLVGREMVEDWFALEEWAGIGPR